GWRFFIVGQKLDSRMGHLPPHSFELWLAGNENPLPFDQLLPQPRLIEPKTAKISGSLLHEHAQQRLAWPRVSQVDFVDDADDACQVAFFELIDVAQLAHVLVSPREEEEQIGGVVEVEFGQQLRPLGADALEKLDWCGKLLGRRFLLR